MQAAFRRCASRRHVLVMLQKPNINVNTRNLRKARKNTQQTQLP